MTPRSLADVNLSEKHLQKHEGFAGFENACYRAKTYVNLTSLTCVNSVHVFVDVVTFCGVLECVYVKYKNQASTTRELPD